MSFYKLAIKEIKKETSNAVSILFNVPQEFQDFYQFVAGQYVTLKLNLDGKEIRRAYSICSSPKSGELRIAIKAIKNGTFSKFANEKLAVGNVLEVGLPEGKFIFEPNLDKQKNYFGLAAGSGITPVISILKSVLEEEPKSSFVLLYGNKNSSDTIFYDELTHLQQKYLGRLFVHYAYSQANVEGQFFGRIDKAILNNVLKQKHSEKEFSKYFLCGPEDMIAMATTVFKEHNVAEKDIKFELFSTSSSSETPVETTGDGHTKITVLVDDEETVFEMSQKQTILEAALKQGLDVPYSCQGGICSSCICKVTEGSATMKKNQILNDAEIEEGLVLACQAVPSTGVIKVDFDDV